MNKGSGCKVSTTPRREKGKRKKTVKYEGNECEMKPAG